MAYVSTIGPIESPYCIQVQETAPTGKLEFSLAEFFELYYRIRTFKIKGTFSFRCWYTLRDDITGVYSWDSVDVSDSVEIDAKTYDAVVSGVLTSYKRVTNYVSLTKTNPVSSEFSLIGDSTTPPEMWTLLGGRKATGNAQGTVFFELDLDYSIYAAGSFWQSVSAGLNVFYDDPSWPTYLSSASALANENPDSFTSPVVIGTITFLGKTFDLYTEEFVKADLPEDWTIPGVTQIELLSGSIEIEPTSYWAYDPEDADDYPGKDGSGPVYDSATGAQLRNPFNIVKRGDGTFYNPNA